jgi:hypothetical protein
MRALDHAPSEGPRDRGVAGPGASLFARASAESRKAIRRRGPCDPTHPLWTFPTPQAKALGPLRGQPARDDACDSRCRPCALRRALLRSSTREPYPSDVRPCRPCSQSLAVSPDPSTQIRDLPLPHFPPACEGSFGLFPGVRCRTPVEPTSATAVPRWDAFPAANLLTRLQIASCRTAERHYRWAVVSAALPPRTGRQTQQQTAEMPLLGKGVLTETRWRCVEKRRSGGKKFHSSSEPGGGPLPAQQFEYVEEARADSSPRDSYTRRMYEGRSLHTSFFRNAA